MPSAQYTETYQKVSKMGEKLKAAGKQGPSNDEQLSVRTHQIKSFHTLGKLYEKSRTLLTPIDSFTPTLRLPRARTSARPRSLACSTSLYVDNFLNICLECIHHRMRTTAIYRHVASSLERPARSQARTSADNIQGKAKYNKWQEQVNAGLSQKDAEAKYIELGNQLLQKHDN